MWSLSRLSAMVSRKCCVFLLLKQHLVDLLSLVTLRVENRIVSFETKE